MMSQEEMWAVVDARIASLKALAASGDIVIDDIVSNADYRPFSGRENSGKAADRLMVETLTVRVHHLVRASELTQTPIPSTAGHVAKDPP